MATPESDYLYSMCFSETHNTTLSVCVNTTMHQKAPPAEPLVTQSCGILEATCEEVQNAVFSIVCPDCRQCHFCMLRFFIMWCATLIHQSCSSQSRKVV